MTQHQGVERIVTDWLVESAQPRVPDYFDSLLAETARTRQRPAWSFLERWIPMATLARPRPLLAPLPWRAISLLAALLLLLVGAAVLVGSQPRIPPPFGPAANGLVAYSADGDIYTADAATGARRAIVGGPANDFGPRWSRDGTRIAFLRSEAFGTARLFVVGLDGRGLTALTPEPFVMTSESDDADRDLYEFSPDGERVLYVAKTTGSTRFITVAGLDGVSRVLDVGMNVRTAAWRPSNSGEIAFISYESGTGGGLYVANADGSNVRTVVEPDIEYNLYEVAWSPDGRTIAYSRWGGPGNISGLSLRVRVVDADGGNDRPIAANPSSTWESGPSWSNDGTRLAVRRGYTADLDDTTLVIVPVDGGPEIETPRGQATCCGGHEWAPDDTSILASTGDLSRAAALHVVVDPATGATRSAPWSAGSPPSWQRLAP